MSDPSGASQALAAYLEELVRLRTQAGLTPLELADRLGVTERDVIRAEAGKRRVGVVELQRWAVACGSTLQAFGLTLQVRTRQ